MAASVPDPISLRPFGNTGLSVTPICVGCAEIGNMPDTFAYEVPEDRAFATVRAIFASELNFLDTSPSYGDGESERRIGTIVRERVGVPTGFVLATKADRDLATGAFTGDQMRRVAPADRGRRYSALRHRRWADRSDDALRRARLL